MVLLLALAFLSGSFLLAADTSKPADKVRIINEPKNETVLKETAESREPLILQGTIIDNLSAASNASDLAAFVAGYMKTNAIIPSRAASGYSLYSAGKLYRFDKSGNSKAVEYLKKKENGLFVEVVYRIADGQIQVLSFRKILVREGVKSTGNSKQPSNLRNSEPAPVAPETSKKQEKVKN